MQNGRPTETPVIEWETGHSLDTACLSVIMPVFNEVGTIDEILRRVLAQSCVCEIIAVDDASTDGTNSLMRSWPQRNPRVKVLEHRVNRGKGAAIRTALAASSAPVVIIQDADLEYDPKDYVPMLQLILDDSADVVYGSRFSARDDKVSNPIWHTLGNRCLTCISNFASGLHLTDEATCFKMFRRELFHRFELEENGFGFCPEVTAKISKLGIRIREIPITYRGRSRAEGKKIRFVDGWKAISCIIKYNYVRR